MRLFGSMLPKGLYPCPNFSVESVHLRNNGTGIFFVVGTIRIIGPIKINDQGVAIWNAKVQVPSASVGFIAIGIVQKG